MVFHNFLGNNFFFGRTPTVGNGDLVIFWPVLGLGPSEKFWAWGENTRTQVPGASGTFGGGKCYQAIRDGFLQLSWERLFSPAGPPLVGNSDLVGFWPILGLWNLEKFRAWVENMKP